MDGTEVKKTTRGRRRSKAGRLCSEITLQELTLHFHQSIEVAAVEMRVGVTALKKLCRKFNVFKWPYRKFQRILRLTNVAKAGMARIEEYQRLAELVLDPQLGETCPLWRHVDPGERYVVQAVFAASKLPEFQDGWKKRDVWGDDNGGDADDDATASTITQASARIVQQKVVEFAAHAPPPPVVVPSSSTTAAIGFDNSNAMGGANDTTHNPFLTQALRAAASNGYGTPHHQHLVPPPPPPTKGHPHEDSSGSNAAALHQILNNPHFSALIHQASLPQQQHFSSVGDVSSAEHGHHGHLPNLLHDPSQLTADSLPHLLEAIRQASLQAQPSLYNTNSNLMPASFKQWDVSTALGDPPSMQPPPPNGPAHQSPFTRPAPFLPSLRQDSLLEMLGRVHAEAAAANTAPPPPMHAQTNNQAPPPGGAQHNNPEHLASIMQHSLSHFFMGNSLNMGGLGGPEGAPQSLAEGSLDEVMRALLQPSLPGGEEGRMPGSGGSGGGLGSATGSGGAPPSVEEMLQSLQDPSKLQMLLNTSSGGGGAAAAGGGGGTDGGMGVIGPPVPSAPPPTASTPVGTVMGNDVQNALAALFAPQQQQQQPPPQLEQDPQHLATAVGLLMGAQSVGAQGVANSAA